MKRLLLLSVFVAAIATVIIPVLFVSISDVASAQASRRMGSCYDKNAKKIPCPG